MNYRQILATLLLAIIALAATGCANWQTVRIQVHDEASGEPVEGASVMTVMTGAVLRPGLNKYPRTQYAVTDGNGMCVAVVDEGHIATVLVRKEGYHDYSNRPRIPFNKRIKIALQRDTN